MAILRNMYCIIIKFVNYSLFCHDTNMEMVLLLTFLGFGIFISQIGFRMFQLSFVCHFCHRFTITVLHQTGSLNLFAKCTLKNNLKLLFEWPFWKTEILTELKFYNSVIRIWGGWAFETWLTRTEKKYQNQIDSQTGQAMLRFAWLWLSVLVNKSGVQIIKCRDLML